MSLPLAIVLIAALAGAFKTKPDGNSFRSYLTKLEEEQRKGSSSSSSSSSSSTPSGWMSSFARLLTTRPSRLPDYKIQDGIVCTFATTDDGRSFLGLFGIWFLLSTVVTEGENVEMTSDNADSLREQAIQAKAKKDYVMAARYFHKAGEMFSKLPSEFHQSESAKSFEDASNCYQILKQTENANTAALKAAKIFVVSERTAARGARLYERVANEVVKTDPTKALFYLEKAKEALESIDDGRVFSIDLLRAEIFAKNKKYEQAIELYNKLCQFAVNDSALKFSVRNYVCDALYCIMALGDEVRFEKQLHYYMEAYPMFTEHPDSEFLEIVATAWKNGDSDRFDAALKRHLAIRTVQPWQKDALKMVQGGMEGLR
ncbi:hypothetical protein HDU76_005290 [Blyttiomyces sp. JEL0837]|nr:hypothetical protein HDU76_005290 [Blyttiomyces sp. JEL0837]